MKQPKLSSKMGVGFGVIVIITILLGGVATFSMKQVNGQTTILAQKSF